MLLKKQIDNNFPRSLSLSTIEMTSKCSKLFFDVISNVDRGTDNGNCCLLLTLKAVITLESFPLQIFHDKVLETRFSPF